MTWREAPPQTVNALVACNAAQRPDATAFSCKEERVSHAQMAQMSEAAAGYLQQLGVGKGDRVAIFLATASAGYLAFALGAMRIGAIAVCLNARFKTRELTHAIDNSGCAVLLHDSRLAEVVAACDARHRTKILSFEDICQDGALDVRRMAMTDVAHMDIGPETPARIIYTSGTTAMPKACLHTHGAMLHQAFAVAERLALVPADRFWTPLPLFHTGGWTPFLAAQAAGAALYHAGFFEAGESLRQIIADRCTILFPSFETIWMQVLTHPDFRPQDFQDARLVLNVGVPERLALMQQMLPQVPQVSNTGCTEVGGWLCIGKAGDSLESRCRTAGTPIDGMAARIINPQTGAEQPVDVPGELVVRGPSCLSEYFGDPEATRAAIDAGGWFHTGDLVSRTAENGFVFISRIKDMLKVGGENVAAAEIEGHILTHPKVLLVAVVAAPDAYYGEVPAAFVETVEGAQLTEQDIMDYCRGAIATFKIPRHVRFVREWPMSGTKIQKFALREIIRQSLAAGAAAP